MTATRLPHVAGEHEAIRKNPESHVTALDVAALRCYI